MKIQRALFVSKRELAALRVALCYSLDNAAEDDANDVVGRPTGQKVRDHAAVMKKLRKDLEEDK